MGHRPFCAVSPSRLQASGATSCCQAFAPMLLVKIVYSCTPHQVRLLGSHMVTARALESGRAVGAGTAEGSSDEFSEDPFGGSNGYLQASL